MLPDPARLHYLLEQYAANNCTRQELLELLEAIDEAKQDETLHSSLQSIWEGIADTDPLPAIDREKIFSNIFSATPVHALPRKRIIGWRTAAAALVILLAGSLIYLYLPRHSAQQLADRSPKNRKEDRAPGGNKAILTLADGSNIVLDSAHNGALTQQGNSKVIKLNNGQLAYQSGAGGKMSAGGQMLANVQYNTIATPRGGQYQVVLPDGTKVWLNAASSLKFPTAFAGDRRRVELTGEAYFEVAKNAALPFIVHSSGSDVEVLGTSFNVNAYDDEETIRTTLLEGSVNVSGGVGHTLLKPGQQAQLDRKGDLRLVADANTEEAIAWKNGYFQFDDAGIRVVMRQLSRWYDVEVSYEGPVPDRQFGGQMPRGVNLSEVLHILEESNVHFRIEGKKLIVTP